MRHPPFFKTDEPRTGSFSNLGPFEPVTRESFQHAVDELLKSIENRPYRAPEPEPVPPWVADLLAEEET